MTNKFNTPRRPKQGEQKTTNIFGENIMFDYKLTQTIENGNSANDKGLDNKAQQQFGREFQSLYRNENEDLLPPAIKQLKAIGYTVGDYVCGRCYSKNQTTVEWEGYLTEDNINLYKMKPGGYDHNKKRIWKRETNYPNGLEFLTKVNKQGYEIYFAVNGGRNNDAVNRVKAFIFESDTASIPEQLGMIKEFPIKPSLVVYTGGKSLHTYYTISNDCPPENWQRIQECLTLATNSDPAIKDLPRLFRLAGFNHQKTGFSSEIKIINPSLTYTYSEIYDAILEYYPQADCKELYQLYAYVARINASSIYPAQLPKDYAYKVCGGHVKNELERLKIYTKLIRDGDTKKANYYLNSPLEKIRHLITKAKENQKEKRERRPTIIRKEGDTLSTVTGTLASRYCEEFNINGRGEYHTCRCPVHQGESPDSLHIHKESGGLKCQAGCDSIEVEEEIRRLAEKKGDPLADKDFDTFSPKLAKFSKKLKVKDSKKSAERFVTKLDNMAQAENSRLVVIKSPMNTGKTYAINQKVDPSKDNILATTHRKLLTRELCRKFGIPYIKDSNGKESYSKGFCIHSWHQFGQAEFSPEKARDAVIVIDEVDQTLWELVAGKTVKNRSFIMENLAQSLRLAKQVWVASAHVTQWEVDLLEDLMNEKALCIENTYKPAKEAGAEVNVLKKEGDFYNQLQNDLQDNKQIMAFVPGRKEEYTNTTTTLAEHYQRLFPNKRIGILDAGTVYEPGHEMFGLPETLQKDPTFLNQFDLLLCTLIINTGISLEETTFDAVYCFGGFYAESEKLLQAMMRVRKFDIPRYIFRDPKCYWSMVAKGAETAEEIYDYLTKTNDKALNDINRATNPWKEDLFQYRAYDRVFEKYYVLGLLRRNLDFKYRDAWLNELLKDEGFTVNFITEKVKLKVSTDQNPKQVKEELKKQKLEKIANTPNPSDEVYKKLKDKDTLTPEERIQKEKGRLCRSLGFEDITDPQIVEADLDGVTKAFRNQYNITVGSEFSREKDYKKLRSNGQACFVSDVLNTQTPLKLKLRTLKIHEVLDKIYSSETVTNHTFEEWFNYVSNNHWDLVKELVFIDPKKKYPETPIGVIKKFLREYFKLSLGTVGRYRNSKGVRTKHYQLADDYQNSEDYKNFRETVFNNWLQRDQEKQRVDFAKSKVSLLAKISRGEKSIPSNMKLIPVEENEKLNLGDILALKRKTLIMFDVMISTEPNIYYQLHPNVRIDSSNKSADREHMNLQDHLTDLIELHGASNVFKVVFED